MKYCPDVFKGLYLRKMPDDRVEVGFCCQNDTTVTDITTLNSVIESKRQQYIKTVDSPQCLACWKVENLSHRSRRENVIDWYKLQNIELNSSNELISLDWNCENLCNLACITCGPIYSSRWATEISRYSWNDNKQYQYTRDNKFFEHLDLSQLRRVYFNGGEPMMSPDHVEILRAMKIAGSLTHSEIAYNTNSTHLPTDECVELWKQARYVRICLSVDALNDQFEFIRYPAQWSQLENFLSFINSIDVCVILDVTCTVGLHNILYLGELLDWHKQALSTNRWGDPGRLSIHPCGSISYGGDVLGCENAEPHLSQEIKQYLESNIDKHPAIPMLYKTLGTKPNDRWVDYLNQLSVQRNLDWRQKLNKLARAAGI